MRKFGARFALGILACSVMVACGAQKRAARSAIQAADKAVASVGDDVAKYAPDQWKGITDSVATAKDSFEKKDYKAAIASLSDIGPRVQAAQAFATQKKTELGNAWTEMSAGLPKMVDAIKGRVDELSSMKKLPKGIDAAALDGAKQGLAAATQAWSEAQDAFKAGNLTDAVAKANTVKQKATEAMQALGMTPPAGS
jgi:hypothetical protein